MRLYTITLHFDGHSNTPTRIYAETTREAFRRIAYMHRLRRDGLAHFTRVTLSSRPA